MKHRPGITLIEVLVAIFIMGIGMITLLTLFPLGALNIASALKDDRTSQAAANADSLANGKVVRHDGRVNGQFNNQVNAVKAMGGSLSIPSSPVYVDPHGVLQGLGFVGRVAPVAQNPGIARTDATYVENPSGSGIANLDTNLTNLYFTLLDDYNFTNAGVPDSAGANEIQRYGRFTWAYMMRRPKLGDEHVVDMTVVTYYNRPPQNLTEERVFTTATRTLDAAGNPTTQLTIPYTAATKPKIRKGGWILDATLDVVPGSGDPGTVRGYFYRVVDISESGGNTMTLELQYPLKSARLGIKTTACTIVEMDNVSEVFERGTGYIP
jgi:hypothetical protein